MKRKKPFQILIHWLIGNVIVRFSVGRSVSCRWIFTFHSISSFCFHGYTVSKKKKMRTLTKQYRLKLIRKKEWMNERMSKRINECNLNFNFNATDLCIWTLSVQMSIALLFFGLNYSKKVKKLKSLFSKYSKISYTLLFHECLSDSKMNGNFTWMCVCAN